MSALTAGFDAITNHVGLLLFPVALDLLLWMGPHLRLKRQIEALVAAWLKPDLVLPGVADQAEFASQVDSLRQSLQGLAERFNLLISLRSYPVGIPSLMSGRLPVEIPGGAPWMIDLEALPAAVGLWLGLGLAGLALGALYYILVAQAVLSGRVEWGAAWGRWPWATSQVIILALLLFSAVIILSLPGVVIGMLFSLMGMLAGQCAIMTYTFLVFWAAFPLLLSAHGIFVRRDNVMASITNSIRLTRSTLPTTGLLFMVLLLFTQGFNYLWNVPKENSWLVLLGIGGHAFVATALLAATFIYYRDADRWVQALLAAREQRKAHAGQSV
jgi:hypothetical protein